MEAFVPNDYRKRVLADVERRGGIEFSDPFELYDIPLEEAETLSDAEVSARVAEVWGFWQKQRDHPKYRVLVGLLVDGHEHRSELLLHSGSRRAEALRVRNERQQRDAERFEMLDTAISRLVQRYGGVPAGKVAGLEEIGAMGGLTAAEVAARLRRHRVIEDQAAPSVLTDQRRKQIRQLLSEWERLLDGPPTPTLFALLQVEPSEATHPNEIRLRADALRARSRELPPGRVRVVLDELLVHVHDLLEAGPAVAEDYVRSITEDVAAELRPKVRAAVLVEDQLVGEDYEFLLEEAIELGLARPEAIRLLAELAGALGARIESAPAAAPYAADTRPPANARAARSAPHRSASPGSSREWEEPLKAARAALRAGRPQEAARHVAEARQLDAGAHGGATPIRPVADEVERVLAEAAVHWRDATAACAAKRFVAATQHLEYLRRNAADVPPPTGQSTTLDQLLTQAREAVATADRLVAEAESGPAHDRTRTLLAAQSACADHAAAAAALAATPIEPPGSIHATRLPNGSVHLTWTPSPTADADYKVTRLQPDGSWRVVGRTRTTELEDGGAPPTGLPVYGVAATVAGRYSDTTRSDAPNPPAPQPSSPPQPTIPPQPTSPPQPSQPISAAQPMSPATSSNQPLAPPQSAPPHPATHTTPNQPEPLPNSPERANGAGPTPPISMARPSRSSESTPTSEPAGAAPSAAVPGPDQSAQPAHPVPANQPEPDNHSAGPLHDSGPTPPVSMSRPSRRSETIPSSESGGAATSESGPDQPVCTVPSSRSSDTAPSSEPMAATPTTSEVRPGQPVSAAHTADANQSASTPYQAEPANDPGARPPISMSRPSRYGEPELLDEFGGGGTGSGSPTESAAEGQAAYSAGGAVREAPALPDEPNPSGIPTVGNLAVRDGRLTFDWPAGVTEVMVVSRPDAPPITPTDPQAVSWKVTNTRYEIDGGVPIQPTLTPCHLAVASCRRAPNGTLIVASGFAATARLRCGP
ncbi:Ig-like domain repeat protein [Nocardia goodfellowii]